MQRICSGGSYRLLFIRYPGSAVTRAPGARALFLFIPSRWLSLALGVFCFKISVGSRGVEGGGPQLSTRRKLPPLLAAAAAEPGSASCADGANMADWPPSRVTSQRTAGYRDTSWTRPGHVLFPSILLFPQLF